MQSTNLEISQRSYLVTMHVPRVDDVFVLFDTVQVSKNIPLAILNDFFKIYRNTKIPQFLQEREKNVLYIFYNETVIIIKHDKFETFQLIIDIKSNNTEQEMDKILDLLQSTIIVEYSIQKISEENSTATFLIPMKYFNASIWSDLTLLDPRFDFYIDESKYASIKKSNSVTIHLDIYTIQIYGHVVTGDTYIRGQSRKNFPTNSHFIRVKILNYDGKESLKSKLLSYLEIYFDEVPRLITEYSKFMKISIPKIVQPTKLKYIIPELFVTNYKTVCSDQPEIVDEEVGKRLMEEDPSKVILFPKTVNEGIPQEYYVCPNPKLPYPGLRRNEKLENREQFPFIPCCFKVDQKSKVGTGYNLYMGGNYEDTETIQQHILKTNKAVSKGGYGYLPIVLKHLFQSANDQNEYLRFGVGYSEQSFFNALDFAIGTKNWKNGIKNSIGQQEGVDIDIDFILAHDEFIDPQIFIEWAKDIYETDIYLFTREGDKVNMITPRYQKTHLTYNSIYPTTVFIYFHERRNGKIQCELIRTIDNASFDSTSEVVRTVRQYYSTLFQFFQNGTRLEKLHLRLHKVKYIGQFIDNQGKVRIILVDYKDVEFTLFTNPLPPLNVPEIVYQIRRIPYDVATSFISDNNLTIVSQTDSEIHVKTGKVMYFIPIVEKIPDLNVNKVTFRIYEPKGSQMDDYLRLRKLAKYTIEYALHNFSKFINLYPVPIDEELASARTFLNTQTIDRELINIDIKNDFTNQQMYANERLIIPASIRERIMFTLAWTLRRKYNHLLNYGNKIHLSNYYESPSDFTKRKGGVIIRGENNLADWIESRPISLNISDRIRISDDQYLLLREEKLYLIHPSTTLESAIYTSSFYVLNGYISEGSEIDVNVDFELWTGNEVYGQSDVKVLGIDDKYYSVLNLK